MNDNYETWVAKRIRFAALFALGGIILVLGSLLWNDPSSFLIVLGAGGALILTGIIMYFMTIVRHKH